MQEFPTAKKDKRPIAELNILLQQWLLNIADIQGLNIENYAQWWVILDLLGRVKQRQQCIDDDDIDNDGIKDYQDNCYTIFNQKQADADQDGIGNVCDDDIDNDTIKNPIGILDDNGNIVYDSLLYADNLTKDIIDNCLIVVNKDQADGDNNGVWNACDIDERVWLSIQPKSLGDSRFVFTSQYSWSLKNFIWYFGDRSTSDGESANHTYRNPWLYTVRLEATTPSGKMISATTTVQTWPWPRAALVPTKLVQNVWEKVTYKTILQNLTIDSIDYVEIQWWDGRTRYLRWNEIVSFIDMYATHGWFPIGWIVYMNNQTTLALGSYVTVLWKPICLWSTDGNNWQSKCDLDKDTIPDICDTDIDGDAVKNPLWIIRFEQPNCVYDVKNVIPYTDITQWWWPNPDWDNCPFTANPDQAPCKWLDKDSDGDWILDPKDACSLIPETFNGIVDTDWCPEYDVNVVFPDTKLQPWTCNACPCQYAKNDSDIAPGDRIKAVLYDKTTQKPVAESQWYVVP
jgi:hypothetical protein